MNASVQGLLRGALAALYVSLFGCATQPAPVAPAPAPVAAPTLPPAAPAPVAAPQAVPGAVSEAPRITLADTPAASTAGTPHIGLILPLKSATFGAAADAVQQGFMAAAGVHGNALPVHVYPCNDEKTEVVQRYQEAVRAGAVAIAGPLTRNGVQALAAQAELPVPTLALNVAGGKGADALYFFGLPAEQEADQAARMAAHAGLLSATLVRTETALSKRMARAFAEAWKKTGGVVTGEIVGDAAKLRLIPVEPGSMVFLAADAQQARLLRPYLPKALPVYATSQSFAGNADNLVNYDLAEVRFSDMPWVLQPDHPAVMAYPRAARPLPQEQERLYALGIDAWRLLDIVYQRDFNNRLPLDGVTGKVSLNGRVFEREPLPALIRDGQGMPLSAAVPLPVMQPKP